MRTSARAHASQLCPDFGWSTLHMVVREIPRNCKSERGSGSSGSSTPPVHQGYSSMLPHSPPPLPPCSSSLGHPLPPEGFHSCFFYAGHSFPKHLQPSLPALPSVSAQRSPSLGAVAEHPV